MSIRLVSVKVHIPSPPAVQVILGQAHFIKTVEDLHEALVTAVSGIKFGLAFCEASEPCLVRWTGTDQELIASAQTNAMAIGAGHSFIVLLRDCFPINILPVLRQVPEVCLIYCATANPVEVILAESEQGRGILGVVDGYPPKRIEAEADIVERKAVLRRLGYKL